MHTAVYIFSSRAMLSSKLSEFAPFLDSFIQICMYVIHLCIHMNVCVFLDFHLHVTVLTNLLHTCILTNVCMVGLGRIRLGNFSESDRLTPPLQSGNFTLMMCRSRLGMCAYMRMHVNACVFACVYHAQWLTALFLFRRVTV